MYIYNLLSAVHEWKQTRLRQYVQSSVVFLYLTSIRVLRSAVEYQILIMEQWKRIWMK